MAQQEQHPLQQQQQHFSDVWMAESARTISRIVDHDAPRLKNSIAKAQQQLIDLERRRGEYLQAANSAAAEYKAQRARLGLGPGPVEAELAALAQGVAGVLDEAVAVCSQDAVQEAVEYYMCFARCTGGMPGYSNPVYCVVYHHQGTY